jgi:predicted restriction endonuclease
MDLLLASAVDFHVDLRDRLDAQGVIWCIYGGWRKMPVPDTWVNDPERRLQQQQLIYASELEELEVEPEAGHLSITQKLSLVQARRGQDKFREKLVRLWSTCAVTSCSELTFLRASHIKPWKEADNQERLDPFNGLLLSPNLDVALDKGLITFEDDGRIRISKQLALRDRKLLGLNLSLRLRSVDPRHLPYLQYHRKYRFKEKTS